MWFAEEEPMTATAPPQCSREVPLALPRSISAPDRSQPVARGESFWAAGVRVRGGPGRAEAIDDTWICARRHRRPHVTWKFAATIDGAALQPTTSAIGSPGNRCVERWTTAEAVRVSGGGHRHGAGRRPPAHGPRRQRRQSGKRRRSSGPRPHHDPGERVGNELHPWGTNAPPGEPPATSATHSPLPAAILNTGT